MKMLRPYDIPIIIVLLIISFIPMLVFAGYQHTHSHTDDLYAVISVNGKVVKKIELSDNHRHYKFTMRQNKQDYNIIEVDGSRIRDKQDNTPDQVAVHTGWINRIGQQSICLPHRLIINIKGHGQRTSGKESYDRRNTELVQP